MVPFGNISRRPTSCSTTLRTTRDMIWRSSVCQHRQHVLRDPRWSSAPEVGLIGGGSGNSLWPSAIRRNGTAPECRSPQSFRMIP